MIKKVYIKMKFVLDDLFSFVYKQLEKSHVLKPLEYIEVDNKNDVLKISHQYPVNFDTNDRILFDEWQNYNTFENKFFKIKDCSVSYNGVVFKGFQNFTQALPHPIFKSQFGFLFILGQKIFKRKVLLDVNENFVLIYDFWSGNNYYHWMIDSLCRIVKWRDELNNCVLLLPENAPKYIVETIHLFEFKRIEYISKHNYVNAKTLLIPNYCAWSGQQHPIVLKQVKEFLLSSFNENISYDRIYVSRGKQKCRKVSNETEVIALLQRHNFQIIYFEGMTVSQQISCVKNAKIFITSHGANVTNAIFGVDIKVLEFLRNDKPNFCYWSALSGLNIPYYYQLCEVVNHDDLFVDIPLLEKKIHSMF